MVRKTKVSPKRRKKPSKSIVLDPDRWVRKAEVKAYRDKLLKDSNNCCNISGVSITTGVLDHDHGTGLCRGVLLSEVNMLEGRYLKLFNKLKLNEKYGISFPDMLISMGNYLKEDYSDNKLHYGLMESFRKKLNRLTVPVIKGKLVKDFGIEPTGDKKELVRLYIQAWIGSLEEK